jgi:hypothetical protein
MQATITIYPQVKTRTGHVTVLFATNAYEVKDSLKARGWQFNQKYRGGNPGQPDNAWSKAFETFAEAVAEAREVGIPFDATKVHVDESHPDYRIGLRTSIATDAFHGLSDEQLAMLDGCNALTQSGEITLSL